MAEICCGLVGENEPPTSVEPVARASRRRLDMLPTVKIVADSAVAPPLENGRKRQKLDVPSPSSSPSGSELETVDKKQNMDKKEPTVGNNSPSLDVETKAANGVRIDDEPKFGMTSVCGRRRDMEDAVSVHPSFCSRNSENLHFFGVFDGHGCSHVAAKCRDRLHEIVKEEMTTKDSENWQESMDRSFRRMDEEAAKPNHGVAGREQEHRSKTKPSASCRCELQSPQCDAVGSTAVVSVVTPEKIVVSNCGDSRAVLCRRGVAIVLSSDHKPDRPDELLRIQQAGGRVIYWDGPRVLGVLAMSRAIGDNYLKPYVIPEPEVTLTDRTDDDECLILASDGLWDVVSNETACGVARMCLRACDSVAGSESGNGACSDAALLLTKLALARHSTDNVSVVVVDLRRNRR